MTGSLAPTMWDVAIIGGGPAAIAASIGLVTEGARVVVLEKNELGGRIATSALIENIIGAGKGMTGRTFMSIGIDQAVHLGVTPKVPFDAINLQKDHETGVFTVESNTHETIYARTVLLAVGATARRLDVLGVSQYEGRGVSHSSPEYSVPSQWIGKRVGIIGGGNSAAQAALFLAGCQDCKVDVFVRGDDFEKSISSFMRVRARNPSIAIHPHSELVQVTGVDGRMSSTLFRCNGVESRFDLHSLHVLIGFAVPTGWLPPTVALDKRGYVLSDRDLPDGAWPLNGRKPLRYETSIPGLFVAGDCHAEVPNRGSVAKGEGATAAVSMFQYLEQMLGAEAKQPQAAA